MIVITPVLRVQKAPGNDTLVITSRDHARIIPLTNYEYIEFSAVSAVEASEDGGVLPVEVFEATCQLPQTVIEGRPADGDRRKFYLTADALTALYESISGKDLDLEPTGDGGAGQDDGDGSKQNGDENNPATNFKGNPAP